MNSRPNSLSVLSALAVSALVVAGQAGAHGGGKGYLSKPHGLKPLLPSVQVSVSNGDEELRLVNRSTQTLFVIGYEGEPYLRFGPNGVYVNQRSPAKYLNQDRYAKTAIPASADPKAKPEWVKVTAAETYAWHDHRIHWMSTVPPPTVRADPKKPHHVFDWSVPLREDGRSYAVLGSLDWIPAASSSGGSTWLVAGAAGGGVALVAAIAGWLLLRRRRQRASASLFTTERGHG